VCARGGMTQPCYTVHLSTWYWPPILNWMSLSTNSALTCQKIPAVLYHVLALVTGHSYMHKLIVLLTCHFSINQTQPPATTSSAWLCCMDLYQFYIIKVLQMLRCNNRCKSYGIPHHNATALYRTLF
jgi:hypothetical protein